MTSWLKKRTNNQSKTTDQQIHVDKFQILNFLILRCRLNRKKYYLILILTIAFTRLDHLSVTSQVQIYQLFFAFYIALYIWQPNTQILIAIK